MADEIWGLGVFGLGIFGLGIWGQGGTSSATTQGGWRGYYHPPKPRLNPELARLLKEWLEFKLDANG